MANIINFQDIFKSDQLAFGATMTIGDIFLSLIITLIIAMFIYVIYKKTYSGILYSKNFSITIVIVSLIVSVIMMAIHNNLALSLGMVGALSIIRYRTAIKDPKDIAFMFWAICIGMVNGVGYYKLAFTSSIFIGVVLVVLQKKLRITPPYMLVIKHNNSDENALLSIVKKYSPKHKTKHRASEQGGDELIFEVKVREKHQKSMIDEIKGIKGIKSVLMYSHEGELAE